MKKLLLVTLLGFTGMAAHAQLYNTGYSVGWDIHTPLTDGDFSGTGTSLRGLRLGYLYFLGDRVSVGGELGANGFDNYIPRQTYTYPGGAATTDFSNTQLQLTAALNGSYYFKEEGKIIPFATLGAGVGYTIFSRYYNVYSEEDDAAGFFTSPGFGVLLRRADYSSWGIHVKVHADYLAGTSKDFNTDSFLGFGFTLGFVGFSD